METLKEKITGLNELLQNGKLLDAFEKYYHEDVSMQENELPPTVGKEANRQREQLFLENVIEFRAADVLDVHVDGVDAGADGEQRRATVAAPRQQPGGHGQRRDDDQRCQFEPASG